MKSLKLLFSEGKADLELNDLKNLAYVTDKEELLQRLLIELNTQLEEWFGSKSFGVDYMGILGLTNSKDNLKKEIERVFAKYEEIEKIEEFDLSQSDTTNRLFKALIKFTLTDGTKLEFKVGD